MASLFADSSRADSGFGRICPAAASLRVTNQIRGLRLELEELMNLTDWDEWLEVEPALGGVTKDVGEGLARLGQFFGSIAESAGALALLSSPGQHWKLSGPGLCFPPDLAQSRMKPVVPVLVQIQRQIHGGDQFLFEPPRFATDMPHDPGVLFHPIRESGFSS